MSFRTFSVFITVLIVYAGSLFAAPIESGFSSAPSTLASPEEKTAAYRDARSKVIAAAAGYEHTPYLYGGIDKRGMDCSGLVYASFRDALGISVPRNTQGLYAWVEKTQLENAWPGDLLFFKTTGDGSISHVGIYLGDRHFIHAASEGLVTGVIYSGLDESYWSRNYAGVGRALPEASVDSINVNGNTNDSVSGSVSGNTPKTTTKKNKKQRDGKGNLLIGIAAAPTWGNSFDDGGIIRGVASQFRVGAGITLFKQPMIFGLELRPEWDGSLGIFRVPLTLSWGLSDKFRIFAGPALSFGDAALTVSGENRSYNGGTSWFGAAGITAAPFIFKIAGNELAPYGEFAWQSYFSDNNPANTGADLAACFRLSTGLRFTWKK